MRKEHSLMETTHGNYASVNGLQMYYEVHGTGQPIVLIHGAYSAIGTSFGKILPELAKSRQVIGVDLQGHGRTADIDRPLTNTQMADDVAALLKHLGIDQADIFGYSMGAGVALELAVRHPEKVRKLILMSVAYNREGFHPGHAEMVGEIKPEMFVGTMWYDEYQQIAPNPENFPKLVEKNSQLTREFQGWSEEDVASIKAPTLLIMGDSDIFRPEHAVAMFRLLGGGVVGDMVGLPNAQLAILPGTTHVTIVDRTEYLVPMVTAFLEKPIPEEK
jgi:pimeloyl-ACP methyl ester carboxylesterase